MPRPEPTVLEALEIERDEVSQALIFFRGAKSYAKTHGPHASIDAAITSLEHRLNELELDIVEVSDASHA